MRWFRVSILAAAVCAALAVPEMLLGQKPGTSPGKSDNAPGKSGAAPGQQQGGSSGPGQPSQPSTPGGSGQNTPAQPGDLAGKSSVPKVNWLATSKEVSEALAGSQSVKIPFEVTAAIKDAVFWLTPSLQAWLEVPAPAFAVLEPGTVYEVEVRWKGDRPEKTIGGTLHLVPAKDAGDGLRRTYAMPLGINVKAGGDPGAGSGGASGEQLTVVSISGASGGPVAPLQILSVYGFGIGPADFDPPLWKDGKLSDYVGDVQVFFDGTAAPILFVSETELRVIVPYDVAGKTSVTMTVTYRDKVWQVEDIPVTEAVPEIFSMTGLGQGPALAFDAEGRPVTEDNPVKPGDWVTFFGTGLGLWKDGFVDGTAAESAGLAASGKAVEVLIGGKPAKTLYIGGAPGMVSAIVQFTVVVPEEMQLLVDAEGPPRAAVTVLTAGHLSKADLFVYVTVPAP